MEHRLASLARQLGAVVLQALTPPPPAGRLSPPGCRAVAPAPALPAPWRDASGRLILTPEEGRRAAFAAVRDATASATRTEAAARHRISPSAIYRGTRVARHPDLAAQVAAGGMSMHTAYCLARLRDERPELAARAEARKSAHARAMAASDGLWRLQAAKRKADPPHPS